MKTWRNWRILLPLLAVGVLSAQETPTATPHPPKPGENVVVHLQGKYLGLPIDVSCLVDANASGGGDSASLSRIADPKANHPTFLDLVFDVKAVDTGYQTQVRIAARVPIISSVSRSSPAAGQDATMPTAPETITYRNENIQTTALLQPGQPTVIFENGETLTATVEKLPAKNAASTPATALPAMDGDGKLVANIKAVVKMASAADDTRTAAMVVAGNKATYSSVKQTPDHSGQENTQPSFGTVTLELINQPGGVDVLLDTDDSVPMVTASTGNAASKSTTSSVYYNLRSHNVVAVTKLGEPLTLLSRGGETITLTLMRAEGN
jgi:hypothetical protein